ncbi:Cytochrome c7 [Terriglobus roseus]|uniref:Cytochrome c7 n=2 Tax=Terriglobus roseus TaxID=392734 RepID=A0A1H4PB93_9BACT|nr:Cytochrome c7 [Terriglobus roseus]
MPFRMVKMLTFPAIRSLFLLIATVAVMPLARAQDAPVGPPPSTAPAPGTVASSGAPTIASPPPGPGQPISFSHKKHIGDAKMGCNDCHEPSRNGSTLAMPQPTKCMLCHAAIATDKPDIKRLSDMAKNEENVQWVRIYRVPSFVTFSHKTHAAAQCQDCHGPVAEREVMTKEKDLSMGGCISCHTQKSAPTTCDTCHQLNSVQLHQPAIESDSRLVAMLMRQSNTVSHSLRQFLAPMAMPGTLAAGLTR